MSTSTAREERAHSIRTVLVASAASAVAAVLTSFFWRSGTPIAAAVTPVIVAVVSELLHRPTARITERITSETPTLSRRRDAGAEARPSEARLEALGEAAATGAQPPEPATEPLPPQSDPTEPTLYESEGRRRRGKIHPRFVIVTAVIAFLIGGAIITLPELLGGGSLGSADRKTTLFGGGSGGGGEQSDEKSDKPKDEQQDKPDEKPASGDEDKPEDRPGSRTQPKEPSSTQPKPAPQQGTTPTQTDTGSTTTTPR